MQLETFLALILFAFTTSITPGPNNMMLFASGVNFGFARTIPHMLGIGAGFLSLLIAVGLGLGALLRSVPVVYTALKFAGGAYLLWVAWKIGTSRSLSDGKAGAKPMTFLGAAAFQWVNPKAWVMAVTAMTQAFGLTHWKAAAERNVIGWAPVLPSERLRDVPIFQAIHTR